jgi:Bacterial Ig-like domain (group 3)/Regulator of chromosome condensation (RCC1) repeat
LRSDGTVWAWGDNYHGELGNGTTCDRTTGANCHSSTPVPVSDLSGIRAIAAGAAHNLALARAGTSTSLTSSTNPALFGQTVTFTATVTSSAGTPSGMVTFKDGTTLLGVASLNGSGQAAYTTSSLSAGTHSITAAYGGDGNFMGSTGSLSQQVAYRACLLYDPSKASNIGSTIGIKLRLCDVNGHNLSSSTISVKAVSVDGNAALLVASGAANPGNLFRFDPKLATGGGYSYKLVTTQSMSTGSHNLTFIVGGDPSITYNAPFKLK